MKGKDSVLFVFLFVGFFRFLRKSSYFSFYKIVRFYLWVLIDISYLRKFVKKKKIGERGKGY